MADIYATYNGGGFIFGVRAKDLTRDEFDALEADQQAAVTSSPLYTIAAPGRTGKKADPAPVADEAASAVKEQ